VNLGPPVIILVLDPELETLVHGDISNSEAIATTAVRVRAFGVSDPKSIDRSSAELVRSVDRVGVIADSVW
jgi:hypothetical protein